MIGSNSTPTTQRHQPRLRSRKACCPEEVQEAALMQIHYEIDERTNRLPWRKNLTLEALSFSGDSDHHLSYMCFGSFVAIDSGDFWLLLVCLPPCHYLLTHVDLHWS